MKKIIPAALLAIAVISACKKENKENVGLAGKWKLTRLHYDYKSNVQADARSSFDTVFTNSSYYVQFNLNGTGTTNIDEEGPAIGGGYTDVSVTGNFTYSVSVQNLSCYFNGRQSWPLVRTLTFNSSNEMVLTLVSKSSDYGYSFPTGVDETITASETFIR